MSRIGKLPIDIPNKVNVTIDGQEIVVKGSKGELSWVLPPEITITQEGETLIVKPKNNSRRARERYGLSRTLVANMVEGVSKGFERRLEIQGVGYRAQVQGRNLILNVGYSNPVELPAPDGITIAVENNTNVIVSGISKEIVGNTAAKIRSVRPPEVYKGKGIRYAGEIVRRKAGKAGKK